MPQGLWGAGAPPSSCPRREREARLTTSIRTASATPNLSTPQLLGSAAPGSECPEYILASRVANLEGHRSRGILHNETTVLPGASVLAMVASAVLGNAAVVANAAAACQR